MKLLSKRECPFCWKVKLALGYLQIPYELEEWPVTDKSALAPYSPQGTAPVLLDGDFAVWDSGAIMSHLEEVAGDEATILPGKTHDRTKARQLEVYSAAFVGRALRDVVFEKRSNPEADWDWDRIHKGEQGFRETLPWLEAAYEGKETFLAAGFSNAECALLPRFILAEHYGVDLDDRFPKLHRWYQYWRAQPLIRETVPWEGWV